ncbi:MAG: hypothetical protein WC558_15650 [Patulibacter sp.]
MPASAAKYSDCGVVREKTPSVPLEPRVKVSGASCNTGKEVARSVFFRKTWEFPDGATTAEDRSGRQWGCRTRSNGYEKALTTCRLYVKGGPSRSSARIRLYTGV